VAELKAARDRKRDVAGKCEGRKSYIGRDREMVVRAKELSERRPRLFLREIAAELAKLGKVTPRGLAYSASAVRSMLES
jgi:hypothetical protein